METNTTNFTARTFKTYATTKPFARTTSSESTTSFTSHCWEKVKDFFRVTPEERRAFRIANRIMMRICRGISRLCWLAIGVVALCIALQFVPALAEVSPPLAEISTWVVDNFNALLEQGLAYIR